MDFAGLHADRDRILTKHFTPGRSGRPISCVVLHYNDGDLSIDGCYDTWQTRPASAHYQVQSDGLVGQLVWDGNTAWHAGDWDANCRSIGIEHANRGDSLTDECIESGAHLVAAICVYYKLGRPQWGVNVFPHNHFSSTDCPGPLREGTSYHDRYMARAAEWYDAMVGGVQPGPPQQGGAPAPAPSLDLGDTSWTGPRMWRELESQLGLAPTGTISGQSDYNRTKVQVRIERGLYDSGYTRHGSTCVCALQSKMGIEVDGQMGHGTVKGIQQLLNDTVGAGLVVDGYYGPATSCAVGTALERGVFRA